MANLLTNEGSSGKLNPVPGAGSGVGLASKRNLSAKLAKWRTAALKAKELPDPWEGYEWHFIKPLGKLECLLGVGRYIFDDIPEERVMRYMYNPRSGKWKTDEIVVKMQSQVFVSPHIVGIPEIFVH